MSAVKETRQPESVGWRTAWHVLRWPAKVLRVLLGLVLVICLLVALAAIGLAWRLAQGPLDITWLARKAETLMAHKGQPPAVQMGQVTIAWNGFSHGAHSGLEIRLHDVETADKGGGPPAASIGHADVSLAPGPLLSATIAPRSIVLDQVQLRATRDAEGKIHFAVGGTGEGGNGKFGKIIDEFRRSPESAQTDPTLRSLELVVVEHATVTLEDEASHQSVEGAITDLVLRRRAGGGITGAANGTISAGSAAVSLAMTAAVLPDGNTHVEMTLAPLGTHGLDSTLLAQLDPTLATIALDTKVTAKASVDLTSAMRPVRGTVQISTEPGTLAVPDSKAVHFARLTVNAGAEWDESSFWPRTWSLDPIEAVVVADGQRESTARITVEATRQDTQYEAHAKIGLDHASFADLPELWPVAWGGHVRPWLTENVTAGQAHDAALTATLAIPLADPGKPKLVAAGGTMLAEEVVIHWLRPVPPIEHAQAVLTVLGPDDLVINMPRASQGPVALRDGVLRFTGLYHKDQDLAITTNLHGRVPDLIKVLHEPRLKLLSAHPVPITGSAGQFSARLSVKLPLVHHLTFKQVDIASQGRLSSLRLGGLVAGRDLEHGDISYNVTQDGLKASGAATIAGVDARAELEMNFKEGAPTDVVQQARMVARVGAAALKANGVDAGGVLVSGAAMVDARYAEQRDGKARVAVAADLGPVGLSVAGWHKPPGAAAKAAGTVLLNHGKVTSVPQLTAQGPGMDVIARAEMAAGKPHTLHVERVVLGPTRLAGEVVFPAGPSEPLRVHAAGPVVDLSDQIGELTKGGSGGGGGGQDLIVNVQFGRVMLGHDRKLVQLAAHVERIGGKLAALQATTGGAERLRASITPAPNGRRLRVEAADTGALLKGLELTSAIESGTLSVDANYDDRFADPPLAGHVQLGNFGVLDQVVVGKLLQAITIYGIPDALRDKGVYFAGLQVPFCLCQNVLRVGPSRASSSSLGVTATGWVDFNRHLMDLNGTVVPAYAINSALGRLPWVGRLFSPERGGGLIAANFTVAGKTAKPDVSVNPLSLLTPGLLRRLFDLFS